MIENWMASLTHWDWFIAAVLLLIGELLLPGYVLLWMGVAAALVGGMLWSMPELTWKWQLFLYSGLSLASMVLSRIYLNRHPIPTDQPLLNRRGQQYVGRVFTLRDPMVNGTGWIHVDDSRWKALGVKDLPAGANVRVVGVQGAALQVEVEAPAASPSA